MLKTLLIEGLADGPNPAVHHVAGADQVGTGPGLGHGLLAEHRHRLIIEHHPPIADDAVVAIAGIGIQGHVGHDRHARMHLLEPANGSGDQAMLVEALGPVLRFEAVGHLGEQHHAADAQLPGATHLLHQPLQAPAHGPWHGPDRLVAGALMHKERIDEVGGAELVLPHHRPQGRGAAQPAGAVGELHGANLARADPRDGRLGSNPPGDRHCGRRAAAPATAVPRH